VLLTTIVIVIANRIGGPERGIGRLPSRVVG